MQVIVHGGAGDTAAEPEPRQATLDRAAEIGAAESIPLDAVESALRLLESDERFNAGVGGSLQSDGIVRTDAGLMTSDRDAGAAAGMPGGEHAVTVARGVLAETPHVLLNGVHAVDFAAAIGVETEVDLETAQRRQEWGALDSHPEGSPLDHLAWVGAHFDGTADRRQSESGDAGSRDAETRQRRSSPSEEPSSGSDPSDHDTVGAVAFDGERFATATSTGGRWLALAGRVGDVPQIGSGFYASPAGAASATGAGEDIAKTTLTRRAVRHVEAGLDAQTAAEQAIAEFGELVSGTAGVIVMDRDGTPGQAYNSEAMQTSVAPE
jgi:isoaspartyl peptidase/L-asparaginase-like protein (Ntn-hydrolase superfamily)